MTETALAVRPPHLPFMSGAPDFVVGLRPIPQSAWISPDPEAASLSSKRALLSTRRAEVYAAASDGGAYNLELEVEHMVASERPDSAPLDDASPLVRAASLTSDDLVVMARADTSWRAVSLVLCSPTFFSAADAIGKDTIGVHAPVPDRLGPGGAQALGARIARVFEGLRPEHVLERFNWTVQAGPERFTPDGAPLRARAAATPEEDALDVVRLRVERQTIRRVPNADAVLFTIRISLDPLRTVFQSEGARDAFAVAWRDAPEHVRAYKKWAPYERLVAAALKDSGAN